MNTKLQTKNKPQIPWRTLILFFSVTTAVIVSFILWADGIDEWIKQVINANVANKTVLASILFAILSSDIFLPVPSSLTSTLCGLYLGFAIGFLVSFLAMGLSALIGYLIGRYFSSYAENLIGEKDMQALQHLQNKSGAWVLLGLRSVPILAEASLIFAGIGRYPVKNTIIQVLLGNAVVSIIYAGIGAFSRNATDSCTPAFIGTLAVSAVFIACSKLIASRNAKPASHSFARKKS